MAATTGELEAASRTAYGDRPNRSPWIAQLAADGPPRPLGSDATADIADEFGWELAGEAQHGFDDAHDLLDVMVREADAQVRVEVHRPLGDVQPAPPRCPPTFHARPRTGRPTTAEMCRLGGRRVRLRAP